jgi:hypothetical protein
MKRVFYPREEIKSGMLVRCTSSKQICLVVEDERLKHLVSVVEPGGKRMLLFAHQVISVL